MVKTSSSCYHPSLLTLYEKISPFYLLLQAQNGFLLQVGDKATDLNLWGKAINHHGRQSSGNDQVEITLDKNYQKLTISA